MLSSKRPQAELVKTVEECGNEASSDYFSELEFTSTKAQTDQNMETFDYSGAKKNAPT
jgi:hypothetical protein